MSNEINNFNGNYTVPTTTGTTTTFGNFPIYDLVNFCPYCGTKVLNDFKFCPACGKEIPRTYTGSTYVIHWNRSDGTSTYPLDGIIKPNIIY